jgi:hypothetical protein
MLFFDTLALIWSLKISAMIGRKEELVVLRVCRFVDD